MSPPSLEVDPRATRAGSGFPTPYPVVLFDGVCNLCDATVQWILRHDRRGVFRFAPLQSRAAAAALDGVPSAARPDSIVLVDSQGRHVESEAVIRIAQRLGGPWALAPIARVLPRGVRDAVYRWVARHRYHWFGRQNACMVPTAEMRDRFLDGAGVSAETAIALPAERAEPTGGIVSALRALPQRLLFTYLVVYMFPFPIGWLPYTEALGRPYDKAIERVVTAFAKAAFGIHVVATETGSGDTTFAYVTLVVQILAALIGAVIWTLIARGRPVGPRAVDRVRTYTRYYLAATLFSYGWSKVIPVQMPPPGPDRLLNTLGNTSPMGLLWTLMGTSAVYQIFAGLGEVTAGFLLFWRRTSLAGALVGCAVLTNVVMMNFCFDVPVKLYSSHLLIMGLFLIAPHVMRLLSILVFNLPAQPVPLRPFPIEHAWLRRLGFVLKLGVFVLFGIVPAFQSIDNAKQYGILVKHTPLHGTYRVDSFVRDGIADHANADEDRWVRFAVNDMGSGGIQRASGATRRFRLTIDRTAHTMTFVYREEPQPFVLRYAERPNGVLRVEGPFFGANVVAVMQKLPEDSNLLTGRGYHWINEYPLNR